MTKAETGAPDRPDAVDFAGVLAKESESIRLRRKLLGVAVTGADDHAAPPDLFGVALSGGGIRSASFCLGALQALDHYGLTKRIDYLSTVSGGGYTGASLIAALTRKEAEAADKNQEHVFDFPFATGRGGGAKGAGGKADVRDSVEVGRIRDHSRFLAPRGLKDIGLSLAILLRGLIVNLLLLLSVLLPLATIIILTNPIREHLGHSILLDIVDWLAPKSWNDCAWWMNVKSVVADPFIMSKALCVALVAWLVGWALRRSYIEAFAIFDEAAPLEHGGKGAKYGRALMLATFGALIFEAQPPIVDWLIGWMERTPSERSWFTSAAALIASILAVTATFRETLVVWIQRALNVGGMGIWLQGLLARAAFYALGLALPLAIYGLFLTLIVWGIEVPGASHGGYAYAPSWLVAPSWRFAVILAALAAVFVVARYVIVHRGKRDDVPGKFKGFWLRLEWKGKDGLALLFLLGGASFLAIAAQATRLEPGSTHEWIVLIDYVVLSATVVAISLNFTENANGLHRLYRDRLKEGFRLGRQDNSPLPLHGLGAACPYLLVNATLNVRRQKKDSKAPGSADNPPARATGDSTAKEAQVRQAADPAKRGRNAEFFLLSKHVVGSESTGYVDSQWMWVQDPELDLAAASAISGAAVSSAMGRVGLGLLGPTLALLNLRLGFWLPNPSPRELKDRHWEDILRLYLFAEIFGQLSSDSSRIYITDGGHIDNIGLYQLLKRRCKFIIVVDAEADAGMNFGAFCDVQRFARIDEGVIVSLTWWPVRTTALDRLANRNKDVKRDSETHKQHFAIGKIVYEDDQEGILLYVKATVTGDEPDYVLDYERRYPTFPHEATSDQFFSEEQMEAYRALGFHAMQMALENENVLERAMDPPSGGSPGQERESLVRQMKQGLGSDIRSIDRRNNDVRREQQAVRDVS